MLHCGYVLLVDPFGVVEFDVFKFYIWVPGYELGMPFRHVCTLDVRNAPLSQEYCILFPHFWENWQHFALLPYCHLLSLQIHCLYSVPSLGLLPGPQLGPPQPLLSFPGNNRYPVHSPTFPLRLLH